MYISLIRLSILVAVQYILKLFQFFIHTVDTLCLFSRFYGFYVFSSFSFFFFRTKKKMFEIEIKHVQHPHSFMRWKKKTTENWTWNRNVVHYYVYHFIRPFNHRFCSFFFSLFILFRHFFSSFVDFFQLLAKSRNENANLTIMSFQCLKS